MSDIDNNNISADNTPEDVILSDFDSVNDGDSELSFFEGDDFPASPDIPGIVLNSRIVDFSSNDEKAVHQDATIMIPSNKVSPGRVSQSKSKTSPIPPAETGSGRKQRVRPDSRKEKRGIPKRVKYMAVVACAVLAVVVTAFFVRRAADLKEYDSYILLANDRYCSGDYSEALTYLRKAGTIKSSDEVTGLMVDCYIAEGNYDMALEALRLLDSSDRAVSERISQVEALKSSGNNTDVVTVLGKQYPASSTSLVLNDSDLENSDLSDIVKLYSLTSLSLAGNNITDISELSSLGGLMYLDLSGNSITDISPVSSLSSLRTLILDSNSISDFSPVYSLYNLTTLSIKGMNVSTTKCEAISAALPGCAVHSETTFSDDSAISLGGASFNPDSESLVLSGSGISDISALSACTKLKYLDLSDNSISDLTPLMSIPGLETLVLSDNNISNIYPIMGITSLKCVHLERNRITDITALTALPDLKEIYLSGNTVTSCSGLCNLNYLETLDLSYTELTDTILEGLNSAFSIRLLNLEGNEKLTGNAVDSLKSQLPNCAVSGGDYPHIISVSGSDFLDNETVLNLSGLGITDINFVQKFKTIESLDLSNNLISNIYGLDWLKVPANLKTLNLAGNSVSDISCLIKLTGLETLDLSGNPIVAVNPLLSLTSLRSLNLTGCNISDDDIIRICNALPNCAVTH